jgi:hypothetical protein
LAKSKYLFYAANIFFVYKHEKAAGMPAAVVFHDDSGPETELFV